MVRGEPQVVGSPLATQLRHMPNGPSGSLMQNEERPLGRMLLLGNEDGAHFEGCVSSLQLVALVLCLH